MLDEQGGECNYTLINMTLTAAQQEVKIFELLKYLKSFFFFFFNLGFNFFLSWFAFIYLYFLVFWILRRINKHLQQDFGDSGHCSTKTRPMNY